MAEPVFISYARSGSRVYAEALQAALAQTDTPAFLDTQDIQVGAQFPRVLADAILGARVFVLFADARYFQSWYCLREMRLALAEFEARVARGESEEAKRGALAHVVIALHPEGIPAQDSNRLPVALATENSATSDATERLVALVRTRTSGETIVEGQRAAGVPAQVQEALVTESLLPSPANLAGLRLCPLTLPVSLGDGFIGRHDELWHLDLMLATGRGDPRRAAAPAVAIHGGPGTGKSRLALEYLYRFGVIRFPGGIFWVDASGARDVDEQHHGIWQLLDPATHTASLAKLREQGQDVAQMLAKALHESPANQSILFILDNVPESVPGTPPRPLRTWCPAPPGEVTILATSRRRLNVGAPGIEVMSLGVLSVESAVRLLARDIDSPSLDAPVWRRVADAVGCLPLALDLLNKAIEAGAANVDEIARAVASVSVTTVLDEQAETLKEFVGEEAVHGVTEAFDLSFRLLPEDAQRLVILLAHLAPTPIPQVFLDVVEFGTPTRALRLRLVTHAFLTGFGDASEGAVPMLGQLHRVLASFLRTRSEDPDQHRIWAVEMLGRSIGTLTGEQAGDWPLFRASLPHVREALGSLERFSVSGRLLANEQLGVIGQLANVLVAFSQTTGDRDALVQAVGAFRVAAARVDRDGSPTEWAAFQFHLANALRLLAYREVGTPHATDAATLFRAIVAVGDGLPAELLRAARTQLAVVLQYIGDAAAAVSTWRELIAATDRAADPHAWARFQNNLGLGLSALASETDDNERAARAAYESALEERPRDRVPDEWAETQANLAATLLRLGARNESSEGNGYLREAETHLREVLDVFTRERRPYDWAKVQQLLGETLDLIGQREGDGDLRLAAADAYSLALEQIDRDQDPRAWAELRQMIGDLSCQLAGTQGIPTDDQRELLEFAIGAFESAMEVFTRDAVPEHWAELQGVRGQALLALARGDSDSAHLDQAIEALRAATDVTPPEHSMSQDIESLLEEARALKSQHVSKGR